MINIISKSLTNNRVRGPKKVVKNLIKGLESIGYPYVLNRNLEATNRLWIHDDISALRKIKYLPKRVKVIVGPNLFINPEDIPSDINLLDALYLQPSQSVKNIWKKKGYGGEISLWPVGVDTDIFSPSYENRDRVLIYFKNRKNEELEKLIAELKKKKIKYEVIKYGSYKENE
jgi:hypothetical protein